MRGGLALLFLLSAIGGTGCRRDVTPVTDVPATEVQRSRLQVSVTPAGAAVYVNTVHYGQTPVTIELDPGVYTVRAEYPGYAPLEHTVRLDAGAEIAIGGTLTPLTSISSPAVQPTSTAAPQLTTTPTPPAVDTPTTIPEPSPTSVPTPSSAVSVRESTVDIPTYPYAGYLREGFDSQHGFTFWWLERATYEAAHPAPMPHSYRALVLENEYLRLVILPELGGRIYRCVFKPTGQEIFYQNAVLKPSRWGPLSSDQNWWLAAGGMEWALPVHEHGYEFGVPWEATIQRGDDAVTVILRDSQAQDRVRAEIAITLRAGRAAFTVRPRLINPTGQARSVQFWLNAMLTLGSPSITADTEFTLPTDQVIVHSTGDATLPGEHQAMAWPIYAGRDMSWYGNWHAHLGVFALDTTQGFAGAYNHTTDLGLARVFTPEIARGVKLFAFGSGFGDTAHYTDDGSKYFEMWGGPCITFWPEDAITLAAGSSLEWTEHWQPFASLGGLDYANTTAALSLRCDHDNGTARIRVAMVSQWSGTVTLLLDGQTIFSSEFVITPDAPFRADVPLPTSAAPDSQLTLRCVDAAGNVVAEFTHPGEGLKPSPGSCK